MADYIDRDEMLFKLRTGWYPQSVEYTEAVGIAEGLIKGAPSEDVAPIVDTVWKMHSEIKERCIKGGIYPAFVARVVGDVARETIEKCEKDTSKSIEKCEILEDLHTRFAVHFGTYTDTDVVKVADVFKLIDRITQEMSEGICDTIN